MQSLDDSIRELLDTIAAYKSEADFTLVRKAYAYAASALAGQRLRDGSPAILRPLAVARTLAFLRVDETVIAAGLLFDPAQWNTAAEDIQIHFGGEVADIVDGVIKTISAGYEYREQPHDGHIRERLQTMAEDVRVLLIMVADRLRAMHSLHCLPRHRLERIVLETRDIYLPLVHRLGLRRIEEELEELCFRELHPGVYYRIREWLDKRRSSDEEYIRESIGMLRGILDAYGMQAALEGRISDAYGIFCKMTAGNLGLDEIRGAIILNVIVKDTKECYEALGLVYTTWKPVPDTFNDHIATPTASMYQGLHTTVIDSRGEHLEMRIRTEAMDRLAERGLISLWWNEEGGLVRPGDRRFDRIREMLETEQYSCQLPTHFNPCEKTIVVFTPTGAIMDLPRGATPVDFAYKIHTAVGTHCIGAKVNCRLMPLSTELRSGDTVEIIAHTKGRPNRNWLEFVKTDLARKRIRYFLRTEDHEGGT